MVNIFGNKKYWIKKGFYIVLVWFSALPGLLWKSIRMQFRSFTVTTGSNTQSKFLRTSWRL